MVCQQGAARPYWKPGAKGIASLWTLAFSSHGGTQTVKMQFVTGAKKIQKESLRRDRESANLPFAADNPKLLWCNFKLSASTAAEKTKITMEGFDMITGEMKNKVDSICDTIWTGGITSPILFHFSK